MHSSRRACLLLAIVSIALSGCASERSLSFFPGVHRISILQGNIITEDKVEQLRTGMTKNQVRYLLGTPLVNDPFHLDQWNYVYTHKDPEGNETRQELTVTFEDGGVSQIEGAYAPSSDSEPEAEEDLS
jgi:outer membrane protein assembly factor BamE